MFAHVHSNGGFLETAFENQGLKGLARKGTGTVCIVMHYGVFRTNIAPSYPPEEDKSRAVSWSGWRSLTVV